MRSALIGRTRELDDMAARAHDSRLITVIGPGGVGKTALARAAADRMADQFPMGASYVDLTRIEDPTAVPGAIASQLGFDSWDALMTSPADRPMLLVVDNCEHLLDATAMAVGQVLGACRQPTIVATSRSPLDLPGESVVSLAPLPLPSVGEDPHESPSVALFLQRCRDAGGEISDDDTEAVVELCRRLDGLPLALEIAAARSRTMSIAEIVSRLDESVEVLDRPRFRGDPRHRSVTTTIRWSHDLLETGAARLLEHLGVFVGPFTASSAWAVAPDDASFETDLDDLVHASLVVVDTTGSETTYRLLDTVRRYALDRLATHEGIAHVYDRFVDHVLARTRELLTGATQSWRPGLLSDLVATYDDVAEALRWCIAHDESPRRAHQLCSALWGIVHQGHAEEITELMRRLIARFPDVDSVGGAQARAVLASGEYVTGHPAAAAEITTNTLEQHPGPDLTSVTLRRMLGQARNALGDREGSIATFRDGARIGHELGMTAMAQELEVAAAIVQAALGDVDAALAEVTEVEAAARSTGSVVGASWARAVRCWFLARVDPATAVTEAQAALDEAREIDYPIAIAVDIRTKAFAQLMLGDITGAAATLGELTVELVGRGALSNVRVLLDVTAALAYRANHTSWERVAATARALPITTLVSSQFELIPMPDVTATPIPRPVLINSVREVLNDLSSRELAAPVSEAPTSTPASLRVTGDLCDIEFEGRSVSVRTTKGITDIARILAAGGREIHCTDLADVAVEQSSTGEVIDTAARRQYEERIRALQSDIEEAEGNNDYARSYRLQVELDTLIDHLASSLGLGKKTRRGTDNAERARSAVTHRVKATIRMLTKLHPSLGKHFEHSINTGTYCSYRPEKGVTWLVESPPSRA